jgi:hypothetical protein
MPLLLDFVGAVSRLTVGIQSDADLQAGLLYNTVPPSGSTNTYLRQLRLNLGLQDRINLFSVNVWRDVVNYYKNTAESRAPDETPFNIYTLAFGPGDRGIPLGTFNMSRTLDPVLYVDLAPIAADPRTGSRKSYVSVYAEAWNLFEIKDGKGKVLFAD